MKRVLLAITLFFIAAGQVTAQEDLLTECAAIQLTASPPVSGGVPAEVEDQFRFVCGQVVNALTSVQPAVGIGFSGGAHTLGTSTTIGRRLGFMPRVSVTARFNAALADVPDLLDGFVPTLGTGGQVQAMGTSGVPVSSLQADVVLGLFNGFDFGPALGGLGAVDLLGSVSWVPSVGPIGLDESIMNAGMGARVGILKQGLIMPGISISGMYRTMLGDVAFGDMATGDPAEFSADLSTLSFRGGVSKGIAAINFNVGAGYDLYTSSVAMNWELICPAGQCLPGQDVTLSPEAPVEGKLKTGAWNLYGNVGLNLVILNIVGELGYQKTTDVVDAGALEAAGLPGRAPTAEELDGGRFFAGVGVRLTF